MTPLGEVFVHCDKRTFDFGAKNAWLNDRVFPNLHELKALKASEFVEVDCLNFKKTLIARQMVRVQTCLTLFYFFFSCQFSTHIASLALFLQNRL